MRINAWVKILTISVISCLQFGASMPDHLSCTQSGKKATETTAMRQGRMHFASVTIIPRCWHLKCNFYRTLNWNNSNLHPFGVRWEKMGRNTFPVT